MSDTNRIQLQTIKLQCVSCGGNLDISPDMMNFACGYCGTQQTVERIGGTISLKLLKDAISKVQVGTDKTASELALKRLQEELAIVQDKIISVDGFIFTQQSYTFAVVFILGAIVICAICVYLFPRDQSLGAAIILGLIWFGCSYIWVNNRIRTIKENNEPLKKLKAEEAMIQERIAEHKAIVDS